MRDTIRKILKESYYDQNKLYSKLYIERRLNSAPYNIKKYLNYLDEVDCVDKEGKPHKCVRIPQIVHVYLEGRY
jgi:hypothetical protein